MKKKTFPHKIQRRKMSKVQLALERFLPELRDLHERKLFTKVRLARGLSVCVVRRVRADDETQSTG